MKSLETLDDLLNQDCVYDERISTRNPKKKDQATSKNQNLQNWQQIVDFKEIADQECLDLEDYI